MNYFTELFRRAERTRALNDLRKLDDHLLSDIGLTRADLTQLARGRRRNPVPGHE